MTFTLEDLSNNENSYDVMLSSFNLNPDDYTNAAEKFVALAKKAVEMNKLAENEITVVESTYFEEAVRNSNSLYNIGLYVLNRRKINGEKIEKLRECRFNDYNEEFDVVEPITFELLQENYINNGGHCYDEDTIKDILNNGKTTDPITREEFPQDILDMFKSKYDVENGFLDLSYLDLTEIPDDLPESIIKLNLAGNKITKIKNLPNSVEELYLDDNNVDELPYNLSQNIRILDLNNNIIKNINNLPSSVFEVDLSNNIIDEIPDNLPDNLNYLFLENNRIKKIPNTLPLNLKILVLKRNNITKLSDNLPPNLNIIF